jgi:hypothetical protein
MAIPAIAGRQHPIYCARDGTALRNLLVKRSRQGAKPELQVLSVFHDNASGGSLRGRSLTKILLDRTGRDRDSSPPHDHSTKYLLSCTNRQLSPYPAPPVRERTSPEVSAVQRPGCVATSPVLQRRPRVIARNFQLPSEAPSLLDDERSLRRPQSFAFQGLIGAVLATSIISTVLSLMV